MTISIPGGLSTAAATLKSATLIVQSIGAAALSLDRGCDDNIESLYALDPDAFVEFCEQIGELSKAISPFVDNAYAAALAFRRIRVAS